MSVLSNAIKNSDIVFNFAGLADLDISQTKPLETAKLNIIGTINSLLMCKNIRLKSLYMLVLYMQIRKKVVFTAVAKKAAEDYIEKFAQK